VTITNGYCTLDEFKHRLLATADYTASTISFTAATKTIADTAAGLLRFRTGRRIKITGSTSNNGTYTIATGDVAGSIVVSEALVDEVAGAAVSIVDVTDLDDDAEIEKVITAISRAIDRECRRRFYAATETRYFTAQRADLLFVDDLLSVTTLKTDEGGDRVYETTWSTTDYDLLPSNAALNGEPYLRIAPAPMSSKRFPGHAKAVEIAGSFGYASSTPAVIKEACLLWSMRVWKRHEAIFGVIGTTALGQMTVKIPPPDPDVAHLLPRPKGASLI
jgi:hypothetical protein